MKNPAITLRPATEADLPGMRELYRGTITTVCANDYDEAQRAVWASTADNTDRWSNLIKEQYVLLAMIDGMIAGFSSLRDSDYLDFMYVHKDYQRMSVAETLLTAIETKAVALGATVITSDVSKTARPFFERKGYTVLAEQVNHRQGLELVNYKMKKDLMNN